MKLIVYGRPSCANCKAVLMSAKILGYKADYKDIDASIDTFHAFTQVVTDNWGEGARGNLPVLTLDVNELQFVSKGLDESLALLREHAELLEEED